MTNTSKVRCLRCGHVWAPRNRDAKERMCSKCRSRRTEELEDEGFPPLPSTQNGAEVQEGTSLPEATKNIPRGLLDDPEVYEKMKELQVARLERQIAEEKEGKVETTALERLDSIFKILVTSVEWRSALMTDIGGFLETYCIWCGASRKNGTHYDNALGGWKCAKCGHVST